MKVVIFIDWFAPAYKAGGPIQSIVNLVNQEIEGVEYKIICSNKDVDGQLLQGIDYDKWVQYNKTTQVWYNSNNKIILGLLKQIRSWKPDIFFINGIYSFYYNFLPIVRSRSVKKIISVRGMLHAGALTQKKLKKKVYLRIWKLLNIHRTNNFHATTIEEEKFIKANFGMKVKVFVAQNLPRVFQSHTFSKKVPDFIKLISIGLVSPMKNYLETIKSLAQCNVNVHYSIYGAIKDAGYWQQCLEEIKKLPGNIKIEYLSALPSSKVQEALNHSQVFILPSKSENFGHAIYEALTAGKPVITSHNTPWNNLEDSKAGLNVSTENNYELSKAICFFAQMDAKELDEWSNGAQAYAKKEIDLEQIKNQYKKMFSAVS